MYLMYFPKSSSDTSGGETFLGSICTSSGLVFGSLRVITNGFHWVEITIYLYKVGPNTCYTWSDFTLINGRN